MPLAALEGYAPLHHGSTKDTALTGVLDKTIRVNQRMSMSATQQRRLLVATRQAVHSPACPSCVCTCLCSCMTSAPRGRQLLAATHPRRQQLIRPAERIRGPFFHWSSDRGEPQPETSNRREHADRGIHRLDGRAIPQPEHRDQHVLRHGGLCSDRHVRQAGMSRSRWCISTPCSSSPRPMPFATGW